VRIAIHMLLWALAIALSAVTMLGLADRLGVGGRPGWVFDLLAHWPRHLAVAALVVGVAAAWRRLRTPAIAAIAAAAINLAIVIGAGGHASPQAAPEEARLIRIVSANVHGSLSALGKLVQLATDYDADIVALYEVPEELTPELFATLFQNLPNRLLLSERPNGWPLIRRSAIALREPAAITPTLFDGSHGVLLRTDVASVQVVTTHPPSPGDPHLMHDRDQQLGAIAGLIDTARPFIIAGDFNTTPWGHAYASVPGERAGDPRLEGTFPALLGPFGLPIDHIKFGGLALTDYRVGPDIGSDHLPLFATFALPRD
jgi:endonuclease/exonuclease/phosphatase (EEP) superfamily protein YafD